MPPSARRKITGAKDEKSKRSGNKFEVWTHNGLKNSKKLPVELAQQMEQMGVGEIVINSIDNDGVMKGYDHELVDKVRNAITVPMTILGGAGTLEDAGKLISKHGIIGAAAGSLFVFKGVYKAVLINYPSRDEKNSLIKGNFQRN